MMLLFAILFSHAWAVVDCGAANDKLAFCTLTACKCLDTNSATCTSGAASGHFNEMASGTAATDLKWCIGPGDNTNGSVGAVGAYRIFFPGETVTVAATAGTKFYCIKLTRAGFDAVTKTQGTTWFDPTAGATVLVLVTAGAANLNTCGQHATTGAAVLIPTANILGNGAAGAAGKICQSKVQTNLRAQQACGAGKVCDLYFDGAANADSSDDTDVDGSCITSTYRIVGGTQAGTTKLRCIANYAQTTAAEQGSKQCTAVAAAEQYCNPGKPDTGAAIAAQRCINHDKRLGGATKSTWGSIRAVGEDLKTCIGRQYFKICQHTAGATQEVCNPYAASGTSICLLKKNVLGDATSGHGLSGTGGATRAAGAAETWCIPQIEDTNYEATTSAVEKDCQATEVCNFASTAIADTCILKTALLAPPTGTAGWTALGQVREAAVQDKYCFAQGGTGATKKYFAEKCISTVAATPPENEVCNPNATTSADVCIVASKVIDHGVQASAGTSPAPNKDTCIGDLAYKVLSYATAGAEETCNWGGATDVKTAISKKELLNDATPLEAYRTDGAKNTETTPVLKYCFTKINGKKSDAVQCKADDTLTTDTDETEVCNPHGERGGAKEKAVCVPKKNVLAYGVAVTAKQVTDGANICIGDKGGASSACLENQACVYKTGTCVDFATTVNTILESWTVAEEGKVTCFGASDTEDCELTYICNPRGTTKGGKIKAADAVETNICVHPDALAENGGYVCFTFPEAEDGEVPVERIPENSVSTILCDADKPYCGTDGTCTADEPTTTTTTTVSDGTATTTAEGDGSHAATTPVWIGLAIAATL